MFRFPRTLNSSALDSPDDAAYRIQCVSVLVRNIVGELRSVTCMVNEQDQCHAGQFENNGAPPREGHREPFSGNLCSELIQGVSAAAVREQLTRELKFPVQLLWDSDDALGIGDDADASQGGIGTANTDKMIIRDTDFLWGKTHQSLIETVNVSDGVSGSSNREVELLAEEGLKIPCYPYVVKSWEFANDVNWGELSSKGTDACESYVSQQSYESHVDFKNGEWNLTNVYVQAESWAWEQCKELDPDTGCPVRIGLTDLYVEIPENGPVRWYYPTASKYASDIKPPVEALPLVKVMLGQYYKNTPQHVKEIMRFINPASPAVSCLECDNFLDLLGDEELKNAIARDVVFLQVTESCNFGYMQKAPMELQEDVEFAFECLNNARSKFHIAHSFCSLRKDGLVRNHVPFALECVKLVPPNLQYCGPAPLDTRELVVCALENEADSRNPCVYYHLVSPRLRGDDEFVIEAIQKFGRRSEKGHSQQKKVGGLRYILENTPKSVLQKSNVMEAFEARKEELGIESWWDSMGA